MPNLIKKYKIHNSSKPKFDFKMKTHYQTTTLSNYNLCKIFISLYTTNPSFTNNSYFSFNLSNRSLFFHHKSLWYTKYFSSERYLQQFSKSTLNEITTTYIHSNKFNFKSCQLYKINSFYILPQLLTIKII